ncbi:zinc ribbon domain-containing protein [Micromonospora sp. NPDC047738]|uniref:zinc ribbon domain-containing protein n=1 Tax=Micromonospora sp. NPDC047738 TaxID=3155741 RepID=UPI0033E85563
MENAGSAPAAQPQPQLARFCQVPATSSTCPACLRRVPKPRGRALVCPHCQFSGHRDLIVAAIIATRTPGGGPTTPKQPLCCRRWSRTVEPADTYPVPASPGVTPAAHHKRREDQLARGGPPHHQVGSRSP